MNYLSYKIGLNIIIDKYYDRNSIVIKRKHQPLNLEIATKSYKRTKIYTDNEKLYIGNKYILLKNIKKVYLKKQKSARIHFTLLYPKYNLYLKIVDRRFFNNISINLKYLEYLYETKDVETDVLLREEIDKIDSFFDWFLFSNDTDYARTEKIESTEYVPINDNPLYLDGSYDIEENLRKIVDRYDGKFICDESNECENSDELVEDEVFYEKDELDGKKAYKLYLILPVKQAKKFINRKGYFVYKSRFMENGYVDVWIDYNLEKKIRDKNIKRRAILKRENLFTIILLLGILLFCIYILIAKIKFYFF